MDDTIRRGMSPHFVRCSKRASLKLRIIPRAQLSGQFRSRNRQNRLFRLRSPPLQPLARALHDALYRRALAVLSGFIAGSGEI
jgi:hypothetical protein